MDSEWWRRKVYPHQAGWFNLQDSNQTWFTMPIIYVRFQINASKVVISKSMKSAANTSATVARKAKDQTLMHLKSSSSPEDPKTKAIIKLIWLRLIFFRWVKRLNFSIALISAKDAFGKCGESVLIIMKSRVRVKLFQKSIDQYTKKFKNFCCQGGKKALFGLHIISAHGFDWYHLLSQKKLKSFLYFA